MQAQVHALGFDFGGRDEPEASQTPAAKSKLCKLEGKKAETDRKKLIEVILCSTK
jgi:hypothetical protein